MFGKRLSELTPDDIAQVIAERVPEASEVEFKETLPSKNGDDPWIRGEDRLGEHARNALLAEVVAFANAYGGTLVLGIAETREKPARAGGIAPVRDCAKLAERLRLQARDCIEPQIALLELAGVPTQSDGSGVVVFRVPRSRVAPHRHVPSKECYVRRADRTEKLTMREIQDLTLQVERGLAAIDRRFTERQEQFAERFERFGHQSERAFGLRATLMPLTPLHVDRVHDNDEVRPPLISLWGTIKNQSDQLALPRGGGPWRPILRGSRSASEQGNFQVRREVYQDGLIEYAGLVGRDEDLPLRLFPAWLMGLFGNALCAAEQFRCAAGAGSVEYALEFEVVNLGHDLLIGQYGRQSHIFGDWLGPLPEGRTIFPRYSIGSCEEFQQISRLFETDFWNTVGYDWDDMITIDYDRAFRELGIVPKEGE